MFLPNIEKHVLIYEIPASCALPGTIYAVSSIGVEAVSKKERFCFNVLGNGATAAYGV